MTSAGGWEAAGSYVDVGGDAISSATSRPRFCRGPPLVVLHGFPTCSYDYASVLPTLARVAGWCWSTPPVTACRPSLTGAMASATSPMPRSRGCHSGSPRSTCSLTTWATRSVAALARDLGGTLPFSVRRRVLTNGSIKMELVELSTGQELLLSLPDEPTDLVERRASSRGFSARSCPDRPCRRRAGGSVGRRRERRASPAAAHHPLIEDRRAEERRFTGSIETHPSPLGVVWGVID